MHLKTTLNKLEFYEIQKILSLFCHTFLGKKYAQELEPSFRKEEVCRKLSETEEAIRLLYQNSSPSITEISDISISLKLLEQDSTLSLKLNYIQNA